jgi:hypothetical protein
MGATASEQLSEIVNEPEIRSPDHDFPLNGPWMETEP